MIRGDFEALGRLADQMKDMCHERWWSAARLAREAGIRPATVSAWWQCRAMPHRSTIVKIGKALGLADLDIDCLIATRYDR